MRIENADDSVVVRQRLTCLLNQPDSIGIVAEADDVPVSKYLVEMLKPEVAIPEALMLTGKGADLLPASMKLEPAPKLSMLTVFLHPHVRKECMSRRQGSFSTSPRGFKRWCLF